MAEIKISELPAADPLDGSEEFPVVQSGETRRATIDNATAGLVDAITASDSLTWHEGSAVSVATGSRHTGFDLTGAVELLGGNIYSSNVGLTLTVDGTEVVNRTDSSIGRDTGDNQYSVAPVPIAKATSSMKLEIFNRSGSDRDVGWRVVTR